MSSMVEKVRPKFFIFQSIQVWTLTNVSMNRLRNAASCDDSDVADPSLRCVPVIGHVSGFFKRETPTEVVEETKSEILENIEHGMEEERYSSDFVERVVFVSERKHATQSILDSTDYGLMSSSSTSSSSDASSSTPVWVPVICALLAFAIVAAGSVLLIRRRMNKRACESNEFEDHVYSENAGFECIFDAGLTGRHGASDYDDYNNHNSASCCRDSCGDSSSETNSSTHLESDEGGASPLFRNAVKSASKGKAGLFHGQHDSSYQISESSSQEDFGLKDAKNEENTCERCPKNNDPISDDYQDNGGVNFVLVGSPLESHYIHDSSNENGFVGDSDEKSNDSNRHQSGGRSYREYSYEGRSSAHRQTMDGTDFDSAESYNESNETQDGIDSGAVTVRYDSYSTANNSAYDQRSGEFGASSFGVQRFGKNRPSAPHETSHSTDESSVGHRGQNKNSGDDYVEEESDGDETFDC